MNWAHFIHRKAVIISTVVFGAFFLMTQSMSNILPFSQQVEFKDRPAYQLYKALAQANRPTRALLVFANHAEQRIGGGFVGSVGILEGNNNLLRLESVRSIYYYDHRIEDKGAFIEPPEYLKSLTGSLTARDSLISVDRDSNARLFRDLYARETGEYIDNVVIITPKVLSLLIRYTGQVELPEYALTVTSDNILSTLQKEVEAGQDKIAGKDPKTILKVLADKMFERLAQLSITQLLQLSDDVGGLMQTQQLYAYLSDQQAMEALNDYQSPIAKAGQVNTIQVAAANHGANKSSQAVTQSVKYTLRIDESGEARLSIGITRQHHSDYTDKYIDPKSGKENYIIGDDLSWVEITLPAGTKSISSTNFVQRGNSAIFGMDVMTKPLTTSAVSGEFILPTRYAMLNEIVVDQVLLAQFGWLGQQVDFTVELPSGYEFVGGTIGVAGADRVASHKFFQIDDEKLKFIFRKQ